MVEQPEVVGAEMYRCAKAKEKSSQRGFGDLGVGAGESDANGQRASIAATTRISRSNSPVSSTIRSSRFFRSQVAFSNSLLSLW